MVVAHNGLKLSERPWAREAQPVQGEAPAHYTVEHEPWCAARGGLAQNQRARLAVALDGHARGLAWRPSCRDLLQIRDARDGST